MNNQKYLEVYSSWASIVGEKQAAHSKLIDIKHQTAIIEVDHPGWSQQILLNKRHIIRNFQKKYSQLGVKDISVIVLSYHKLSYHFENTEKSNREKTELPREVQEAFKRLKMSISERD